MARTTFRASTSASHIYIPLSKRLVFALEVCSSHQMYEKVRANLIGHVNIHIRESVLCSDKKKNTSVMVDDTSVGALLPGEANPTQA